MTKYDEAALRGKFAPTPRHGAAYAVAIGHVGGWNAVGDCSSRDRYLEMAAKLDELRQFARATGDAGVVDAYEYGIAKVDMDMRARLEVVENARRVEAAMATLPRPQ